MQHGWISKWLCQVKGIYTVWFNLYEIQENVNESVAIESRSVVEEMLVKGYKFSMRSWINFFFLRKTCYWDMGNVLR